MTVSRTPWTAEPACDHHGEPCTGNLRDAEGDWLATVGHHDAQLIAGAVNDQHRAGELYVELSTYRSDYDGAAVVQIDTTEAAAGHLRVYVNDGTVWDADPELASREHDHRLDALLEVVNQHRRERQARSCTGCDWTAPKGSMGDRGPGAEATRVRHASFNLHVAELQLAALDQPKPEEDARRG